MHLPVLAQYVSRPSLTQFFGATYSLTLFTAWSMFLTILFLPAMIITFSGPKVIAATLFAFPSTLYKSPSSVMAFEEQRKKSAEKISL